MFNRFIAPELPAPLTDEQEEALRYIEHSRISGPIDITVGSQPIKVSSGKIRIEITQELTPEQMTYLQGILGPR